MSKKLSISSLLANLEKYTLMDVRTKEEFEKSTIPTAKNLPIFDESERKEIGTRYKQISREDAFKKGASIFGKKIETFIDGFKSIYETDEKPFLFFCWRGGMRSKAMQWLSSSFGIESYYLKGGYKSFRKRMMASVEEESNIFVIGGYTGTGKTRILRSLAKETYLVLDLEKYANHRGSVMGLKKGENQPLQEEFENRLGYDLYQKRQKEKQEKILVEDESERIGKCIIPSLFWKKMRKAEHVFIDIDFDQRMNMIMEDYGRMEHQEILHRIKNIYKRLGGNNVKKIEELLEQKNRRKAYEILLRYYDKKYEKGYSTRETPEEKKQKVKCKNWEEAKDKVKQIVWKRA